LTNPIREELLENIFNHIKIKSMKIFTLLSLLCVLSTTVKAQEVPCPNVGSNGFITITTAPNCTGKVAATVSSTIPSDKSLSISVFVGNDTTGRLISSTCFIVPGNTTDSVFQTPVFDYPCDSAITFVIRRFTASNGTCSGGECGPAIRGRGPGGAVLPIKLTNFFAERKGNNVLVSWKTESEINAKEYQLERNTGGGFTRINTTAARNSAAAYSFSDNSGQKNVSQYRLRLIDNDGSFKFSNVVAVKGLASVSDFVVFPNPSMGGNTRVTIADVNEATTLQLVDYSGRLIKNIPTSTSTIDLTGLKNGTYLIRITNNATGGVSSQKLIVAQ